MHRHRGRIHVRLEEVQLGTAGADFAQVGGGIPAVNVRDALHELLPARALGVAVAEAVLRPSLVLAFAEVALLIHGDEVHCAVQPAGQLRDVHVERELAVLQLEHLVCVLAVQHVHAGAIVRPVFSFDRELQLYAIGSRGHPVRAWIALLVHAVDGAVLRTVDARFAEGLVPAAGVEAIVVAIDVVHPTILCVERHRQLLGLARGPRAFLHRERGRGLLGHLAHLLRTAAGHDPQQLREGPDRHGLVVGHGPPELHAVVERTPDVVVDGLQAPLLLLAVGSRASSISSANTCGT
mmetsp:Transcript_49022/g.132034  ORF Transcript_49022/g.132034 Transcript_49022/m.132034 type:complete len:294 (-) Transcript_49022:93-974(-)